MSRLNNITSFIYDVADVGSCIIDAGYNFVGSVSKTNDINLSGEHFIIGGCGGSVYHIKTLDENNMSVSYIGDYIWADDRSGGNYDKCFFLESVIVPWLMEHGASDQQTTRSR
ncbi:hypothetical protein AGMMS49942_04700 [Spirochaetia bacterium]|nr:hypothetical protein AGMMS49942_04700 [Spirochaetia bacterium]